MRLGLHFARFRPINSSCVKHKVYMPKLGKPIAVGRTSEVFSWGNDKILKLAYPSTPSEWIADEFSVGKYVQQMGLPVPRMHERVRIHDRQGIVFEKIAGPSLLTELTRRPWKASQYARLMAGLHAQVHALPAPLHLGAQREWLREEIFDAKELLPDAWQRQVIALLDALPDGNALCHGDFHPGNILMSRQGPVIIDWMTAAKGSAAGDVAITSLLLAAGKAPIGALAQRVLAVVQVAFHAAYLRAYFQIHPEQQPLVEMWRTVVAASRLGVSLPEERAGLLDMIGRGKVFTTETEDKE